MAQYPIKMLKDESGKPFIPLTSIKAVIGEEYVQMTFTATEDSTGHFTISNDKLTDEDLLNKIIAVSFPDGITATTNSYLKLNNGTEYLIKDENGSGPLLVKDFVNVVCFLMKKETSWQLVKTGAAATLGSGGHTIVDGDGNVLPQQSVLQFKGFGVSDNAGTGSTVISTPALVNNLTTALSGTGPLDAYQGKVLNDKLDSTIKNYLPLEGGTLTGHLYLDGVNSSGMVGNTSKIIFGNKNANYANITATTSGIYFTNTLTDDTAKVMGYNGDQNSFQPVSNNTTASLGTSTRRWDTLYVNKIDFVNDKYYSEGNYAMNLHNSDLIGVNSIYFQDAANSSDEGLMFYRGEGVWDTFRVYNGVPYLNLNHASDSAGTQYTMLHSGNYSSYALPISGGKMSGNIGYTNGDYSDYDMIKWKTGDANGAGIVIGGGGAVVIGGGESADRVYSGTGIGGSSEVMYICNDQAIQFYPGQQSAYTAAGMFQIAADGALTKCNGVNVPGVFVQSGTPTAKQTGDIWFKT